MSLKYVFEKLNTSPIQQWDINVSFMQIYKEEIYDLLNPDEKKLVIR